MYSDFLIAMLSSYSNEDSMILTLGLTWMKQAVVFMINSFLGGGKDDKSST